MESSGSDSDYPDPMRVRVRYSGRVQGVGFRATMHGIAARRPITGWVRNEPDGTVLAEVQGEAQAVEDLLAAVRSEMSRCIRTESRDDLPDLDGDHRFEIRR